MRTIIFPAVALMTSCVASIAHASIVAEIESNNSLGAAQNIDGSFSLDFSPDIGNITGANTSTTIPHVTINGTGNGTFDYYRFTVTTPESLAIFDIDYGSFPGGIDTKLGLFNSAGTPIASNDDFSTAAGEGAAAVL